MPKKEIDYSNTIIYKITCKEPSVTELYVGHTTNFVQRKHAHKQNCINDKASNYKYKLYEVIRDNGGWNNWRMEIVNFFNCKDHYEARIKEQEYFVSLNATLNSVEPMPKPKFNQTLTNKIIENKIIYKCETCNITCKNENLLEAHNKTKKHSKNLNKDNLTSKSKNKDACEKPQCNFYCETCDFTTSNKKDYNRHLMTRKHKKRTSVTNCDGLVTEKSQKTHFPCENCSKVYNSRNGIWLHKKKCAQKEESTTEHPNNVIIELLKQNQEFKDLIIEQNKQILELAGKVCGNTINNTTNNTTCEK